MSFPLKIFDSLLIGSRDLTNHLLGFGIRSCAGRYWRLQSRGMASFADRYWRLQHELELKTSARKDRYWRLQYIHESNYGTIQVTKGHITLEGCPLRNLEQERREATLTKYKFQNEKTD